MLWLPSRSRSHARSPGEWGSFSTGIVPTGFDSHGPPQAAGNGVHQVQRASGGSGVGSSRFRAWSANPLGKRPGGTINVHPPGSASRGVRPGPAGAFATVSGQRRRQRDPAGDAVHPLRIWRYGLATRAPRLLSGGTARTTPDCPRRSTSRSRFPQSRPRSSFRAQKAPACISGSGRPSTTAQYSLTVLLAPNCAREPTGCPGFFAQIKTPETGRSSRWTIPR